MAEIMRGLLLGTMHNTLGEPQAGANGRVVCVQQEVTRRPISHGPPRQLREKERRRVKST